MTKIEYTLNKAFNLFLFQALMWQGLANKVESDKEMGFNPVKNKEKMLLTYDKAVRIYQHLDLEDMSQYKSYYPLVDHIALIEKFRESFV